ncbi:hypothetical protein QFZ56_007472 [Streptomyces achromogenes]|uniref:Uncharacterized protein n=1 Tax=Streptomyces achromogenes TaxID=67255 RepID=A0ABU0QCX2_STRAH|nr:hypothetical protein [Streptomyces achromogenes]MDQ0688509.1 hypothetical protein [Streptomyces achromogenes]
MREDSAEVLPFGPHDIALASLLGDTINVNSFRTMSDMSNSSLSLSCNRAPEEQWQIIAV